MEGTLSNQSMNQHGAVVPSSRLMLGLFRGVYFLLHFRTCLGLVGTVGAGDKAMAQVSAFNVGIDLKS